MSDNQSKLISQLSKKLNLKPSDISAAKSGDYEALLSQAQSGDRERIEELLGDPDKMKQVLSSPQAQRLIKLLNENE